MIEQKHLTTTEWEVELGRQVRNARVAAGVDQAHLADRANVSLATLSNLERGKGSSLKTLVAVVRALDRTEWLEGLAPTVTVSPMHLLRAARSPSVPMRVRSRRRGHR